MNKFERACYEFLEQRWGKSYSDNFLNDGFVEEAARKLEKERDEVRSGG